MEASKYVFISHRNVQPDLDITKRMYEYLSNQKYEAWYDQGSKDQGLRAGDYAAQISGKLHGASAYILVASRASLKSDEVIDEIGNMRKEHQKNGKPIIPFVLDDYYFNMDAGSTEDYFLGSNRFQAVVLNKFESEEAAFYKIVDYLKDILECYENNPKDFVFDDKHRILKKYNGNDSIVAVPSFIEEIADNAFCFNNSLEKVKIPQSVKSIGQRAFFGCSNLIAVDGMQGVVSCDINSFGKTGITLDENNEYMLNGVVFGGQPSATGILQIPQGTRVIATRAFSCSDASEIIFPVGLEHIGVRAFIDCCEIKEVKFPASLKTIGVNAFEGCGALRRAVFVGAIPSDASKAFNENVEITEDNK